MECSLAALIACFSWSNFYIDGHVTAIDRTFPRQEWRVSTIENESVVETWGRYVWTDEPMNPYGGLAIGIEIPFRSVTISAEAGHLSSLQTDRDKGINGISIKARWYPFRQ